MFRFHRSMFADRKQAVRRRSMKSKHRSMDGW
jgi:hypothetical protein